MLQQLVQRFLEQGLSRRGLMRKLNGLGLSLAGAQSIVESLQASEEAGKGLPVPGSTTMTGTGGELVMAQAKAAGAEYLFTNPGSFEVGFFDAQPSSGIPLIMGLHEGIVISMADGYHRVSGKPAFVNVHVIAGTAQMAGQLYNASRDGSALVVSAGMLDNEMWSDEGMLAPRPGFDQKEVTRQFTKICWEAREPQSLPLMLRRAFKVAHDSPSGPVFVALPINVLEQDTDQAALPPGVLYRHAEPDLGNRESARDELALGEALRAVARGGVRHLVPEDRREPRVVPRDRKDARVDGDLSARQAERVHLLVLDHRELPLEIGTLRGSGDAAAHTRDLRPRLGCRRDLALLQDLGVRLLAHLRLFLRRHHDQLRAAGDGRRLTGDGKHQDQSAEREKAGAHRDAF